MDSDDQLQSHVDRHGQVVQSMMRNVQGYIQTLKPNNKQATRFFTELRNTAATETYVPMKEVFEQAATKLQDLSVLEEQTMMNKFQTNTQPELKTVEQTCVMPVRRMIQERKQTVQSLARTAGTLANLRKKTSNRNTLKAERMAKVKLEAEHRLQVQEESVEEKIGMFEERRIEDLKFALRELISSKLEYHLKAVEDLSSLIKSIHDISPSDAKADMLRRYTIRRR
eukprot:TRINITY_DN649405_c0_g1_i1.p1 TRINITY_DN649405_c0_g1~~TRINITY_DN649405_c0_g1_i1.p1  ORF type:complete len:226 (+),score=51.71 TRINITY_DN649405_c0_g1_i1:100-777(+)